MHNDVQRIGQWIWCCGVALPIDPSMALAAMPHGRTRVSYSYGRTFEVRASVPDLLEAMTAKPDDDMADIAAKIRAAADRLGEIAPASPIP